MVWFTNQSLLLIALAFLLGLLVGYLWWGLRLRRVRSAESSLDAAPLAATAPAATAPAAEEPPATTSASTASDPTPTDTGSTPEPATEPVPAAFAAEPAAAEAPAAAAAEPVVAEEPPSDSPAAAEPVTGEPVTAEPVAAEAVVVPEAEPISAASAESIDAAEPVAAGTVVDEALVAEVESAFATEAPAPQDDLERIEGIGPKIAAALRAAGITTYAALADAERSTVEDALADANLRFAPSLGTWARQARLLADGDEAGFKELTDRLIAGREVTEKPSADGAAPEDAPEAEAPADLEPESIDDASTEPPVDDEATNAADAPVETSAEVSVDASVEAPVEAPAETAVNEPAESTVDEPAEAPVDDEAPTAENVSGGAPAAVIVPAQPVGGEELPVDDLKRIEGIGPKMSAALVAAGIRTFSQLAASDVDTLRAAIEAAGLRFAPSIVTWARQAQLLADGDEEGFADLTRRLVAGRDTGRS
ncbi:helix-hairpin-helix domain-containing protein [Dactylosporangium sucinum]|uniref:helix-hairpin-helix domain-containing protein n=1 Tax=Dactylosporangium sucinum TaxID=1424081 RepID=UPI00167C4AE3|nr:helix-hairpin-helix domain-containing protein [Dactylosporangium sucinum]